MEADRRAKATGANGSDAVQQDARPHHFAYRPNLVVVDGARPQAEAAARAMADRGVTDVAVCGLSKRPEPSEPRISKRRYSDFLGMASSNTTIEAT